MSVWVYRTSATDPSHLRIWGLIPIHHQDRGTAPRMQQCIQAQLANPLEPWPHTNTRKLNRAGGNQSVYSTCHPSFGKICLFVLNSVKTLNKHSTNHIQIKTTNMGVCWEFWGLLLTTRCRNGRPGNWFLKSDFETSREEKTKTKVTIFRSERVKLSSLVSKLHPWC